MGRWSKAGFGPWAADWGGDGGGRTRRGDIKYIILELLVEKPRHGYDIIKDLEERRGGMYRPSPGSVYPTLQMLEEGGYVTSEAMEGKKVYTITPEGRQLLDSRGPQEQEPEDRHQAFHDVRDSAVKLALAVKQAMHTVDPRTSAHLKTILDQARRDIYALLAEDLS